MTARDERKTELARMCMLEIRRTLTLVKMTLNDGILGFDEAIDIEFWGMLTRLRDKALSDGDLPLLRELVVELVGNSRPFVH